MSRLLRVFALAALVSVSASARADPPVSQTLSPLPAPALLGWDGRPLPTASPAPRMNIETISKQETRTAGWIVLGGSLAVATGLFVASLSHSDMCQSVLSGPGQSEPSYYCQKQTAADPAYVLGAFAVAAVGGTIGLVLITREDEKKVTLTLAPPSASYSTGAAAMVPSGLILRGLF